MLTPGRCSGWKMKSIDDIEDQMLLVANVVLKKTTGKSTARKVVSIRVLKFR
jgi:hypothetical protein